MGLVHCDERGLSLLQHFWEAGDSEALGGDEKKVEFAVEIPETSCPGLLPRAAGMNLLRTKTACLKFCHLVVNQRQQGTDHQSDSAARKTRELVAEGFSRPSRHDQ